MGSNVFKCCKCLTERPLLQALSSLHPECELLFQLEQEERSCLRSMEEQSNGSTEGVLLKWLCSSVHACKRYYETAHKRELLLVRTQY